MIKNIVILFLFFILCSLLFQNKKNVDILVEDLATTKENIDDGAEYVSESFKVNFYDNFSDKEFQLDVDIPSGLIQKEGSGILPGLGSGIQEETFLNEDKK